jgi:ferredoxin-NADP reductase
MPRLASKLIERHEVAEGTMAFALERPAGFEFAAGQYLTITLPDPPYNDAKGNSRTFSIASAPDESEHLLIATRMTGSALKRSLAEVPLGTPVSIFGPVGEFTLPPAATAPLVFIAGGIGITPFRSMVLDAAKRQLPHQITLIYSNRTPEGAPFLDELAGIAATYPSFRYLPTITDAEHARRPWIGERRLVNADFLRECVGDVTRPTFYLAGPPGLVVAVTKTVLEAGADPAHVLAEEFSGYESKPPQTATESKPVEAAYMKVAKTDDLAPGQMKAVDVNGKRLALCNVDSAIFAFSDECPHAGGWLSEGDLFGKEIVCPLHGATFDVTTGAVVEPPADEPLTCYSVRITGSEIEVKL